MAYSRLQQCCILYYQHTFLLSLCCFRYRKIVSGSYKYLEGRQNYVIIKEIQTIFGGWGLECSKQPYRLNYSKQNNAIVEREYPSYKPHENLQVDKVSSSLQATWTLPRFTNNELDLAFTSWRSLLYEAFFIL